MTETRTPLSKARDAWMESGAGLRCRAGATSGLYLENRLQEAFEAGWRGADKWNKEHYDRLKARIGGGPSITDEIVQRAWNEFNDRKTYHRSAFEAMRQALQSVWPTTGR